MTLMSIKAIFPGPRTSTRSDEGMVFPYLLKDLVISRANQVWSVDITYIKLPVGTVYLFALIDWYSRFVVAHKLVTTMEACHGIEVMELSLMRGVPEICNADQGAQFTGHLWINTLLEHDIKISHDGVGRCIDNVKIERFWRTIKYEDIFIQSYDTVSVARKGIELFIEYYNYDRPHQALGYKTPAQLYNVVKKKPVVSAKSWIVADENGKIIKSFRGNHGDGRHGYPSQPTRDDCFG